MKINFHFESSLATIKNLNSFLGWEPSLKELRLPVIGRNKRMPVHTHERVTGPFTRLRRVSDAFMYWRVRERTRRSTARSLPGMGTPPSAAVRFPCTLQYTKISFIPICCLFYLLMCVFPQLAFVSEFWKSLFLSSIFKGQAHTPKKASWDPLSHETAPEGRVRRTGAV